MAAPFHPYELISRAYSIEGYKSLLNRYVPGSYVDEYADIVVENYEGWPEDQGFGSSDFTYAVKSFIDNIIRYNKLPLKTEFSPYLKIVKS